MDKQGYEVTIQPIDTTEVKEPAVEEKPTPYTFEPWEWVHIEDPIPDNLVFEL